MYIYPIYIHKILWWKNWLVITMKQNTIAEAFLEKVEDPVAPKIYRLIRGNQLKFTEARSDILTHQLTRTCDGEFTCPWWNQDGDLRCQENAEFHFPKCDIIQKWCRWTSWFSGEIPSIEPSTVYVISFELLATGSSWFQSLPVWLSVGMALSLVSSTPWLLWSNHLSW